MNQKNKVLKYYDIKMECMIPTTLTYRVMAETPEDAARLIENSNPIAVKTKIPLKKPLKLMVYEAGTTMMVFVKNFFRS